jgi:hypothetical protein
METIPTNTTMRIKRMETIATNTETTTAKDIGVRATRHWMRKRRTIELGDTETQTPHAMTLVDGRYASIWQSHDRE